MNSFMGISGKKLTSICFLLAVLFITLALGSLTFLINDNDASLPDVGLGAGLEGNKNMKEGNKKMKEGNKNTKEGNKNTKEGNKNTKEGNKNTKEGNKNMK